MNCRAAISIVLALALFTYLAFEIGKERRPREKTYIYTVWKAPNDLRLKNGFKIERNYQIPLDSIGIELQKEYELRKK